MIDALLQILAPVSCVYCRTPKTLFCKEHFFASEPISEKVDDLSGYFAHELDAPLTAALSAFKDRSMTALAPVFAKELEQLIFLPLWQQADLVVIPPTTPKAYRSRGFVPVKFMLRNSKNKLPVIELIRAKRVLDQRRLNAQQRSENLSGAFRANSLAGKKVLLFDDVLTTSSTLREMRRAVEAAGGEVSGFCVLARRFVDSAVQEKI